MSKRKVGTVHFTVEGSFITEFCRDLVREGDWRKALESLKDSVIGIGTDYCIDILSGKAQLVGSNEFELVEDDRINDDEWVKRQYYSYFTNVVSHKGKLYRPYGVVSHLDGDDLEIAMDKLGIESLPIRVNGDDCEVVDLNCMRAETYKRKYTDFVFHSKATHEWILSELLDHSIDYPVWLSNDDAHKLSKELLCSDYKLDEGELSRIDAERDRAKQLRLSREDDLDTKPRSSLDNFLANAEKSEELFSNPGKFKAEISNKAEANGGWLELSNKETGANYKLPKNAFYRWCLSQSTGYTSIEWTAVSPSGAKMGGDDPNHTDWWLFTGLPMDIAHEHNHPEVAFFNKMRHKYAKKLTGADITLLTNIKGHKGFKQAWVRHVNKPSDINFINNNDVIIIPNASPDFEAVAHRCAEKNCVLITETGGKLCHLSTVGREFGLALYMLPGARDKYPMACSVSIDLERGKIKTLNMEVAKLMELKLTGMFYK